MSSGVPRISVIGLGKLGAPMVAVFAYKGHDVIGLDINARYVASLANGRAPVDEPRLQELIDLSAARIRATSDFDTAVLESDVTFIIVPTPSQADFYFTNKYVLDAINAIGAALRKKPDYHLVVVTSTVMPGSMDRHIQPALEASSGRKVGANLGLCYNPEFIALGSVINDMLRPDMILIGQSDAFAGELLAGIYRRSTETSPEHHRMNFVNAELTKIAVNTYVTTKISYANMIADVCDRLPNADALVVTQALGADSRIGKKYLKSAIGYGGPCFPRDNKAFSALARRLGASPDLAEATDRINDLQVARLEGAVAMLAKPGATVAILGLSYKPDTAVIDCAQGVAVAERLASSGYGVIAYDPMAMQSAKAVLPAKIEFAEAASSAIASADLVVITTPWAEFNSISPAMLTAGERARSVLDPWRILSSDAAAAAERYEVLGRPQAFDQQIDQPMCA
jgi:UDPglucose 6-dehydrogenase